MLLAGGILIAVQTVVRALIVLPSYYWQDDFFHMFQAQELGLSSDFLVRDHNDHLEIVPSLVYWLIGRDTGGSFLPAAVLLVGMQLLASVLLLAVLRELFGRSLWILVPFAAYLFSPLGLPAATWMAAGLEAMPLQIGMLTALLGLIRSVRRRSWRWAVVSAAGTVVGLLSYEKALLILPLLIGVLVLVEWAAEPLEQRFRLLVRAWPYLVAHVVLVAAYVPFYLSVVETTGTDGDVAAGATASGETITRLLLPGIFGGPWTGGAQNTVLPDVTTSSAWASTLLFLAVVAASFWLRGDRALNGWLLGVGYVVVDLALVQLLRSGLVDQFPIARDPRYITDALPVLVIGVCAAFTGPLVQREGPSWVHRLVPSTRAAVVGIALIVSSCLFSTAVLAEDLQHRDSRDYVDGLMQAMDDEPAASVISTWIPANINLFPQPDGLQSLLAVLGEDRPFDRPGTDLRVYDVTTGLRPIVLLQPMLQAAGGVPGCGWQVAGTDQQLGELAGPSLGPEVLQVGYRTDQPVILHVSVGGDEQVLSLAAGAGRAGFVVTGDRGAVTTRVTATAPATVCLDGLVVGTPWPQGVS
ncbi:hypothetical protein [Blastococcus sp. URHD0036]|uniref:hypothetical protein n=1 Tax=Blastococcus sp. URHD0036 TaxID=1380356 RepID=UPI000495A87C|nr:hypothetical protein [Blastococcus sp. URHD0036]